MKQNLNKLIIDSHNLKSLTAIDTYQMCTLVRQAFRESFTRKEIMSEFGRADLWTVKHETLLYVPQRENESFDARVMNVGKLPRLFHARRADAR